MLKSNDQNEITKASTTDLSKRDKDDDFGSQRVYKKTSQNSVLTLYLGTRDIICRRGAVEPLHGVVYVDPKYTSSHKIFGQLTLTFRYGREDEEVMGLKFCNEAIIALKQIWPATEEKDELSPLQQALVERLGKSAYPFSLEVGNLAPPSVQLVPAKRYNGAPIGTSYDVRVHLADQVDERCNRRSMVRLGVRVIHKISAEARAEPIIEPGASTNTLSKSLRSRLSPKALKLANKFSTSVDENQHRRLQTTKPNSGSMSRIDIENRTHELTDNRQSKGPECSVDKPFLWTEGRVSLRAALDKSAYVHGEPIAVTIDVRNDSRKIIRKIRIIAVQHVDVCMFSNGKFKNIVADITECNQIKPNENHKKMYKMLPTKGPTKNWIAVEGSTSHYNNSMTLAATDESDINYKIASSAPRGPQTCEERNVFAIYVSYYIKVKLTLSGMGGEVSLKLPFILGHVDDDSDNEISSKTTTTKHDTPKPNENRDLCDADKIDEEEFPSLEPRGSVDEVVKVFVHDQNVSLDDDDEQCDSNEIEEKFRNAKLMESHKALTEEEDLNVSNVVTAQIHSSQQCNEKQQSQSPQLKSTQCHPNTDNAINAIECNETGI